MRFAWLERIAIGVASIVLAGLLIALLSGYFTGHDPGSLSGVARVGERFADQGNELLSPGAPAPLYASDPPTSGPHALAPVRADATDLTDDEILTALSVGDVVVLYGTPVPPPGLSALATKLSGPFTPSLAASGLAVILGRRVGTGGITALAWTRMLRLRTVDATLLTEFTQDWLGRGAPSRRAG